MYYVEKCRGVYYMYNVWVPVMNRKLSDKNKRKLIEQLKRLNPEMIMLVFNRVLWDENDRTKEKDIFLENKGFIESAGFKVGAWLAPTIGYGTPKNEHDNNAPFTHLKKLDGNDVGDAYCPLDERFVEDYCKLMKQIALTGVEAIMFEDDFTFTGGKVYPATISSCCCDKHMELYQSMLGEEVKREDLSDLIYKKGPNKYREIWFKMQAQVFKDFCAKIEKETHSVNPNVRIGLSANSSSYIQEGIGIHELAHIIAGNTKPFIRMTGAPYWQNLPLYSTNIDAIRVQTQWCGEGIDLYSEGDTFPRPRHWVPSAKLEMYDMIIRADGRSAGTLKYMIDYNSSADYETGYIDRHILNKPAYDEIEKRFKGDTVGLHVFEYPELLKTLEFGEDYPIEKYGSYGFLPLTSQFFVGDNSIPTTYQNTGDAALVFGENANYIDDEMLNNGLILDAHAAKILHNKGIDVGLKSYKRCESPKAEIFFDYDEQVVASTKPDSVFYEFDLKDTAIISSIFFCTPPGLGIVPSVDNVYDYFNFPACYFYENSNSQRFMVYSFTALTCTVGAEGWSAGVFRSYTRQKQLTDGIKWLQKGRPLPAMCMGNPELYILCKRNGNELTVGMWNIFPDSVLNPVIQLDGNYSSIDCFNCNGKISEDKVILDREIPAYGYCFFTVK